MNRTDIKWLFFDLGNTLISEEEPIRDRIEGLVPAFGEKGIAASFEDVEQSLFRASAEFASRPIARAIELLTPHEEDRSYVMERLRYRKDLERPYPGAVGLLSSLSTRYQIGVIANQSPGTEARLQQDGLAPYISLCLSSAELGMKKPDPAIFSLALEQADCEPHAAVMIGDRVDNDLLRLSGGGRLGSYRGSRKYSSHESPWRRRIGQQEHFRRLRDFWHDRLLGNTIERRKTMETEVVPSMSFLDPELPQAGNTALLARGALRRST